MIKILFTGGTGFFGRNLVPKLREKYIVVAPTRQELDLRDLNAVDNYIKKNKLDKESTLLKDSLNIFLKLHQLQDYYGK